MSKRSRLRSSIPPDFADRLTAVVSVVLALSTAPSRANPALTPGVWANISPPGLDLVSHYGTAFVQLDPSHPSTVYLTADMQGLWKSVDGGSNWARLGTPPASPNYGDTTDYLDSPVSIAVDPADSRHLYVTQGVRGTTQGFWVTRDGGATWILSPGYDSLAKAIGTRDVTTMSIDPTDFNHVLVGSHSPWKGLANAGILETKDGGGHWTAHAPASGFTSATMGVNFLFDPATKQGDAKTWLIGTDGQGLWRTTDGGDNFTRVTPVGVWPDFSISHGGQSIFYAQNGTLYAGAFVYPARSTDNGLTWTSITGDNVTYASYYAVMGDGVNLYTLRSFAANDAKYDAPFLVSPESDGLTWTPYEGGKQKFDNGPYTMRFDKENGILYAACWNAGLWALKVTGSAAVRGPRRPTGDGDRERTILIGPGESLESAGLAGRDVEFFGLDGKRIADRGAGTASGGLGMGAGIRIMRIKKAEAGP
ncbi:MAG: hypothetical protein JF616_00405 [Fibrobacteres bacterium]|nr:hypothetical protein [Fibrobacterota bacterium]